MEAIGQTGKLARSFAYAQSGKVLKTLMRKIDKNGSERFDAATMSYELSQECIIIVHVRTVPSRVYYFCCEIQREHVR